MKISDFLDPSRSNLRSYEAWRNALGDSAELSEWRRLKDMATEFSAHESLMGSASMRAAEAAIGSSSLQAAREVLGYQDSARLLQQALGSREAMAEMERRAGLLTSIADLTSTWATMTGSAALAAAKTALPSILDREMGRLPVDRLMAAPPVDHISATVAAAAAGQMQDALAKAMGGMDAATVMAVRDRAQDRWRQAASQGSLMAGLIAGDERERQRFLDAIAGTSGTLDTLMAALGAQNRMALPEAPTPFAMLAAEVLLDQAAALDADEDAAATSPAGEPSLHELMLQMARDVAKMEREAPDAAQAAFRKSVWLALVTLVLTLLLQPITDFYIKRWLESANQQPAPSSKKALVEAAREVVKDLRHLDGYRYVYGQRSVSVRRSDSARAVVIGFLPAGSTVEVLEVRGASTRIEWKAADGQATVAGWVFTRYLRRFQ